MPGINVYRIHPEYKSEEKPFYPAQYNLIEEFRQPMVDRVVIAHVNLGQDIKITDGLLDADTRKIIGEKVLGRLESVETYKGKKYQIRSIIQMQARNLASFLRGQQDYKPFTFKW